MSVMSFLDYLQRYIGASLALLACLAFTLMDASAQSCMRHGLGPAQVALYRMIITIPIISTFIYLRNPSYFAQLDPRSRSSQLRQESIELEQTHTLLDVDLQSPSSPIPATEREDTGTLLQRNPSLAARLIWLRSVLRGVGLCLAFASMQRIAISEYATVYSPSAFLIGFLCWVILREPFGWRLRIAAVLSTIAVAFVVQPPFIFGTAIVGNQDPKRRTVGFLCCLGSLFVDALEMFVLRYVGSGPDPLTMTLAYGMACLIVCPLFMLVSGESLVGIREVIVYAQLMTLAILGVVSQMSLVMAMQRETGATVSVIMYAQIPFSVIVQSFLLYEIPNLLQIVGGCIILSSGIWAIVAESKEEEAKEAKNGEYLALPARSDIDEEGQRGTDGFRS